MAKAKIKRTIGRLEHVSFPELGLANIEAKIDTGAYTTALHCHDIKVVERDGEQKLCFKPLRTTEEGAEKAKEFCTTEYGTKEIRNSFGEVEKRYIIKTSVCIGRKRIRAFISLTDRGNMRFPVLIGRRILKNRFIVDVSQVFLSDIKQTSNK
jgi:hypothetical protein